MTYAPANLLAVRALLREHLNLSPAALGITGDTAHIGGYHCGSDRVRRVDGVIRDYSVIESSRDRAGLTLAASALDIGSWSVTVGGRRHDLRSMSLWLVAQCREGTADTRDIREVIYSPDGKTVRRWDRLGIRSTGDGSHLFHTHISYHRDSTGRDQTALWKRYLTSIGLIKATVEGDSSMTGYDQNAANVATATTWRTWGILTGAPTVRYTIDGRERIEPNAVAAALDRIEREQYAAKLRDAAILAGINGLDDAAVMEHIDQQTAVLREQAQRHVEALSAQVDQVDENTVARLGGRPVEDVADTLRTVYAGRPDALRRLAELLAGPVS